MATPVKALVDATGVSSRQHEWKRAAPPTLNPPNMNWMGQCGAPVQLPVVDRFAIVTFRGVAESLHRPLLRIRMDFAAAALVKTFPPIYKEWVAYTGRLFPTGYRPVT